MTDTTGWRVVRSTFNNDSRYTGRWFTIRSKDSLDAKREVRRILKEDMGLDPDDYVSEFVAFAKIRKRTGDDAPGYGFAHSEVLDVVPCTQIGAKIRTIDSEETDNSVRIKTNEGYEYGFNKLSDGETAEYKWCTDWKYMRTDRTGAVNREDIPECVIRRVNEFGYEVPSYPEPVEA